MLKIDHCEDYQVFGGALYNDNFPIPLPNMHGVEIEFTGINPETGELYGIRSRYTDEPIFDLYSPWRREPTNMPDYIRHGYANPWINREQVAIPFKVIDLEMLERLRHHQFPLMWHPAGPMMWSPSDLYEPLHIVDIRKGHPDRVNQANDEFVVQVKGKFSGGTHNRAINRSGYSPTAGKPPSIPARIDAPSQGDCDKYPIFAACVTCDIQDWLHYTALMEARAELALGLKEATAVIRKWRDESLVYAAAKQSSYMHKSNNSTSATDHKAVTCTDKAAKEDTMKDNTSSLINSLKSDILSAAKRGSKVAASCAAADLVVDQVRSLVGVHYPKFFTENPFGKALEPIAVCSAVLALGYAVQVYAGTKLPFHDMVMDAARYALEGKVRDSAAAFVGPVTALFGKLGAELEKQQAGEK